MRAAPPLKKVEYERSVRRPRRPGCPRRTLRSPVDPRNSQASVAPRAAASSRPPSRGRESRGQPARKARLSASPGGLGTRRPAAVLADARCTAGKWRRPAGGSVRALRVAVRCGAERPTSGGAALSAARSAKHAQCCTVYCLHHVACCSSLCWQVERQRGARSAKHAECRSFNVVDVEVDHAAVGVSGESHADTGAGAGADADADAEHQAPPAHHARARAGASLCCACRGAAAAAACSQAAFARLTVGPRTRPHRPQDWPQRTGASGADRNAPRALRVEGRGAGG